MNQRLMIAPRARGSRHAAPIRWWMTLFLFLGGFAIGACGDSNPGEGIGDVGEILLRVQGLQSGTSATVRVSSTDGMNEVYAVPSSHLVTPLEPGTYTVDAARVPGYNLLSDTPVSVDVQAGKTTDVAFTYERAALSLDVETLPVLLPMNGQTTIEIKILRGEGFDGPVTLRLNAPDGTSVTPENLDVDAQTDVVHVTLSDTAATFEDRPLIAHAEGVHDGKTVESSMEIPIEIVAVVTSTDDAGVGTLRNLVEDPRTEGRTIIFDPDLFATPQTIAVESAIEITHPLSIQGPEVDPQDLIFRVTLSGQDYAQIFRIESTDVFLKNLALRQGHAAEGGAVAIEQEAEAHIEGCLFTENAASIVGGALYTRGLLTLVDTVFTSNQSETHGGAVYMANGETSILGSTFRFNEAKSWGGGVYAGRGALTIQEQSLFQDNKAGIGGAVMVGQGSSPFDRDILLIEDTLFRMNEAGVGGAVVNYWTGTIRNSVIQDNHATGSGGGIRNHLSLRIESSSILDNAADEHQGGVFNDGVMTIEESFIHGNRAATDGGGVFHGYHASDTLNGEPKVLIIRGTEISDNEAGQDGGGVYSIRRIVVEDSWLHDNYAARHGGGLFTATIPHDATEQDGGTAWIRNTTFNDNTADIRGGGLYSSTLASQTGSTATPDAPIDILNSTFTQNVAGTGGAIYLGGANDASTTLYFSTVVGNIARTAQPPAGEGGGGIVHARSAPLVARGNLLSDNQDEVNGPNDSQDLMQLGGMPFTSRGYNVLGSDPLWATLHAEDLINQSALVDPLDDQGGFAPVMELTASSLFDLIPESFCTLPNGDALIDDQRGESRPQGAGCSPGAFER